MRKYRIFALIFLIIMLVVPYFATFFKNKPDVEAIPEIPVGMEDIFNMEISLYRTKSGKVETLNCFDYICGVVAGEMPASYETEALKAQTVAAFTYMVNKMEYVKQNPDSDIGHNGAYVCDDYTHCKAYLEKSSTAKKWGNDWYAKYYPSIELSVTAVLGKIITCNNLPINAVFHAVSNGKTCSAKEVWGTDISYLQSVESVSDTSSPDFKSVKNLTHTEFCDVFYDNLGVVLTADYKSWLGQIKKTDSGMVEEIIICETAYAGTYIRKLFSLKSSTFDIKITDSEVEFTVYGYGHGVGMSQYGANEMAKLGCTYDQILKHYYIGVEIADYKI